MFRVVVLLTASLGLLRDYVFSSEKQFLLIFSIFIIDALGEVITKAFLSRALNKTPENSIYFRKPTIVSILNALVFMSLLVALAISALVIFFGFDSVSLWIVAALPFAVVYRYLSVSLLAVRRFNQYYFLDLSRAVGIFICFYFGTEAGVLANSMIFALVTLVLWGNSFRQLQSVRNYKKVIFLCARKDIWIVFQSGLVAVSYILDKLLLSSKSEPLFYLLLTKFVLFSVGFFNSMFLLKIHVDAIHGGHRVTASGLMAKSFVYLAFFVFGYFIFFGYLVPHFPVAGRVVLSDIQILLGGSWLILMLAREVYIRSLIIKGHISEIGKIMTAYGVLIFAASTQISTLGVELMLIIHTILAAIAIYGFHLVDTKSP